MLRFIILNSIVLIIVEYRFSDGSSQCMEYNINSSKTCDAYAYHIAV